MTPAEAAIYLGRSKMWVWSRCRDGTLPHVTIGSRVYLRRADLVRDNWLTE